MADALAGTEPPQETDWVAKEQLPATFVTFAVRLAGPFTEVVQEYPVLVAVTLLHAVPDAIPLREKFPEALAVTLEPHTETVAPDPFAPKVPETE